MMVMWMVMLVMWFSMCCGVECRLVEVLEIGLDIVVGF